MGAITTQVLCGYVSLWHILEHVLLQPTALDCFVWKWTANGEYSVSVAYRSFFVGTTMRGAKELWKAAAPPKVSFSSRQFPVSHYKRCNFLISHRKSSSSLSTPASTFPTLTCYCCQLWGKRQLTEAWNVPFAPLTGGAHVGMKTVQIFSDRIRDRIRLEGF
jgi:hypothetical protein